MLLADGIIMVVAGVFLVGLIGFFFMAVALVMRFLGYIFRSLTGTTKPTPANGQTHGPGVACPAARCGHVNPADARFCARCGRPLGGQNDVDAYG